MTTVAAAPDTMDSLRVRERSSRVWFGVAAVFAVSFGISAVLVHRAAGLVPDDAFITMRYARNLADGHGWVYNLHQHNGNGDTAPLYTIALAALYRVHDDMFLDAKLVFVLSVAGAATLTFATFRMCRQWLAGLAAAIVLLTSPWLLSTLGMESALFVLAIAAVLAAHVARRPVLVGVLLVIAFAIRGDAILLAFAVVVAWWVRDRRPPWRMVCTGLGVGTSWLIVTRLATGAFVPNTLAGKIAQGQSGFFGTGRVFLRGFVDIPRSFHFSAWFFTLVLVALLGLVRALMDVQLRWYALPLLAFVILHVVAYGLVLDVPGYHWYYAPEVFALTVFAGAAIGGFFQYVQRRPLALAAVLGATTLILALVVVLGVKEQDRGNVTGDYEQVAAWLNTHTPAQATIASTEIGAIGWNTNRTIIDYLGLLDSKSVNELGRGDLRSWLPRTRPDYWLVHSPAWPFEAPALSTAWFHTHYRPIAHLDTRFGFHDQSHAAFDVYERINGNAP